MNLKVFRSPEKNNLHKQFIRVLSYDYYNESGELRLPKNTKVVICGGGTIGASIAYYLAKLGWGPQTVVMEKERYYNFK